jgi:hypothetical protein
LVEELVVAAFLNALDQPIKVVTLGKERVNKFIEV